VREAALEQWRAQAGPSVARLLPGCGTELLLPEAYYVACREADKLIRPVSVRAAVHYLTYTLGVEPGDLRAVIAGFGDEANDSQVDEYRVGFTLRQSSDVVYGIVWPLYGQEDEEGTPMEGPVHGGRPLAPMDEIVKHLNEWASPTSSASPSAMWRSTATTAARRCSPTRPANWCMPRCRKIRRRGTSTSTDHDQGKWMKECDDYQRLPPARATELSRRA
jgi:hypothetical protein